MNSKWFLLSRRVWGMGLLMLGAVLPQFGVDPSTVIKPLTGLGNDLVTVLGLCITAWHFFRPDGKKLTLTPSGS